VSCLGVVRRVSITALAVVCLFGREERWADISFLLTSAPPSASHSLSRRYLNLNMLPRHTSTGSFLASLFCLAPPWLHVVLSAALEIGMSYGVPPFTFL
jgi:hypothetical protein